MALTSSAEVSESPWQLYNGAGLIQSQGRMVGLAGTQRENWSRSETYSSQGWCTLAAACSVTEEKTFCRQLHPTFASTLKIFAFLSPRLPFSLPLIYFIFELLCLFTYFSPTTLPCLSLPLHFPLYLSLALVSIQSIPHTLSVPPPRRPLSDIQEPDRISLVPLDLVVLLLSLPEVDRD